MRVEVLVILGAVVASADCGWGSTSSESKLASRRRNGTSPEMTIGLIVPHTNFGRREYTKAVNRTVGALRKSYYGRSKVQSKLYSFLDKYNFTQHSVQLSMMRLTPSPTGKVQQPEYFFFQNFQTLRVFSRGYSSNRSIIRDGQARKARFLSTGYTSYPAFEELIILIIR